MGWPDTQGRHQAVFRELAAQGPYAAGKVRDVQMLGLAGKVKWSQEAGELRVDLPPEKISPYVVVFKVLFA